jgi:hypothetical protein
VTTLRRFLVLAALMFWQGGFVFYASVVVPVGRAAIDGEQSVVTQIVTNYLNLAGVIALLPLAWDVWATRGRPRGRWILWLGIAATLPVLVWLHSRLDAALDPTMADEEAQRAFEPNHRLYLWVSTFQWACAVVFVVASLRAWSNEDRGQEAVGNGAHKKVPPLTPSASPSHRSRHAAEQG